MPAEVSSVKALLSEVRLKFLHLLGKSSVKLFCLREFHVLSKVSDLLHFQLVLDWV